MNQDDLNTLWIGAFRYYLGRTSYAVASFCDTFVDNFGSIPDDAKMLMRIELKEAFKRDGYDRKAGDSFRTLGHDCDRQCWQRVLSELTREEDDGQS